MKKSADAAVDRLHSALADLPCFLLYVGWRRAQAFYRPVSADQSPQRVYLLSVLRERGDTGVSALAQALDLDVASASGLISRMEREGLPARTRSGGKRSEVMVRLTPPGERALDLALEDRTPRPQAARGSVQSGRAQPAADRRPAAATQ